MLCSYKYKIYPTDEQKVLFSKTFGCCRFVCKFMHMRTLLLILLIGVSNSVCAQKIRVSGDVCNMLTQEGVNR
ncbi:hypothetical protein EVA_22787, partial [gut metagenome]